MVSGMLGGGAGMAAGGGRGVAGRAAYSPLAIASMLSGGGGGGAATTAAVAAAGAAAGTAFGKATYQWTDPTGGKKGLVPKYGGKPLYQGAGAGKGAQAQVPARGSNKLQNALLGSLGLGQMARFGAYGAAFLAIQKAMSAMKDMLDYEKALYDFGRAARLTNEELMKLSSELDNMALATGRGRTVLFKDMADSFTEISKAIGSTDTQKIADMWKILQATGTEESTLKALEGAFKSLNLNEKNLKNLANIMQLPGAEGITDVKELAKWLEDMKNKGGVQIFSDKEGKNLRDFADIWDRIMAAKARGGTAADFFKEFTPEKVANINSAADAMERLLKLGDKEPGAGWNKLKDLFGIIGSGTVKPVLDAMDQMLNQLMAYENIQALKEAKRDVTTGVVPLVEKFLEWNKGELISPSAPGKLGEKIREGAESFFSPYAPEGFPAPTQITILNYGGVRTEVIDTSGRGKKVEVKKVQR
jgi:hypothetical protein